MPAYVPNYDKFPVIKTTHQSTVCWQGWEEVLNIIQQQINSIYSPQKTIAFECYTGILDEEVIPQLQQALNGIFYYTKDFMLDEDSIQQLIYLDVTDDEVF